MMSARRREPPGLLISVEGIEGAGKSTQVARLATWLGSGGREIAVTSEPDGTPLGARVRRLLGELPPLDPLGECFLFAAVRAEHVRRVVRPALERGAVVICDRYVDSTVAYQGYGRGVDLEIIAGLNRLATDGLWPDLTLVLDLEAAEGLSRVRGRLPHDSALVPAAGQDPFERLGLEFHERVRKGYRAIHERDPERVALVDAAQPESAVTAAVRALVARRLGLSGAA